MWVWEVKKRSVKVLKEMETSEKLLALQIAHQQFHREDAVRKQMVEFPLTFYASKSCWELQLRSNIIIKSVKTVLYCSAKKEG